MAYDIVFVRGSLPFLKEDRNRMRGNGLDYVAFHHGVHTLVEARNLRMCSGDIVVHAGTLDIVQDYEWLWDWEKTASVSYARSEIDKFK